MDNSVQDHMGEGRLIYYRREVGTAQVARSFPNTDFLVFRDRCEISLGESNTQLYKKAAKSTLDSMVFISLLYLRAIYIIIGIINTLLATFPKTKISSKSSHLIFLLFTTFHIEDSHCGNFYAAVIVYYT